jgi:hypothetical protein
VNVFDFHSLVLLSSRSHTFNEEAIENALGFKGEIKSNKYSNVIFLLACGKSSKT